MHDIFVINNSRYSFCVNYRKFTIINILLIGDEHTYYSFSALFIQKKQKIISELLLKIFGKKLCKGEKTQLTSNTAGHQYKKHLKKAIATLDEISETLL